LILFHKNSEVPKLISLETFAGLAVIVDKYDLHEAVQMWVEIWRKSLDIEMANGAAKSIYLLMIGWVFGYNDFFEKSTATVCRTFKLGPDFQFEYTSKKHSVVRFSLMEETPQCVIGMFLNFRQILMFVILSFTDIICR